MQYSKRKALNVAILLALSGAAATGVAQTQPAQGQQVEKIEITGSNIRRVAEEGALPLTIIKREDIERSGATSVSELLRTVTGSPFGGFDERSTNLSSGGGFANVSLRGLGARATLVLINGRRVAPAGFGGATGTDVFTDLNSLPIAAIDRVEILRDGASAVYGADAVGGVINVILRRDYKGGEVLLGYGLTQKSDGGEARGNITYGIGDIASDRFNALVSVDYFKRDRIRSKDRDWSSSANFEQYGGNDTRSLTGSPGSYRLGTLSAAGAFTPTSDYKAMPGCPAVSLYTAGTNEYCLFDFLPFWDLMPSVERVSGYAALNVDLTGGHRAYVNLTAAHNESKFEVAPTPLQANIIPKGTAGNPFNSDVQVIYRTLGGGPRANKYTTDFMNLVAGVKGSFGPWDYDTGVTYSESKTDGEGTGYINRTKVAAAFRSGLLQPFVTAAGKGDDTAAAAAIGATTQRNGTTRSVQFDAKTSRELMSLAGGPMAFALGAEFRKEKLTDAADEISASGQIDGANIVASSGSRKVKAAFVELSAPFVKGLDATLAARVDSYDTFGSSVNPKLSLGYRPNTSVLVRGSVGTGFRAPNLIEQYLGRSESFNSGVIDPLRCPTTAAPGDCGRVQIRNFSGGNSALDPEKSKQFNFGFVFEPIKDATLSIDYFNIDLNNQIGRLGLTRIVSDPLYSKLITRDTPTPADIAAGLPGAILFIDRTYQNLGKTKVSGIDLDFTYRYNFGEYGVLSGSAEVSYIDKYKQAAEQGQALIEYAGTNGIPRVRSKLTLNWERGPWKGSLSGNYVGVNALDSVDPRAYDAEGEFIGGNVSSMTTWDIRAGYLGFKNMELAFGIKNLFDKKPVWDFAGDNSQGYNADFGDPRGRNFYASMKYKF